MKTVKNKLKEKGASDETVAEFEKGAQKYVKEKLLPNFKDFEFFTGESMDVDGMYVHRYPRYFPTTISMLLSYRIAKLITLAGSS
jgi:hypothetical protein